MKRRMLLPFAILAVAPVVHAEAYSDTKLYTQATGDALVLQCDATDPEIGGIGGACFTLDRTEERVSITVDDIGPLPVGGAYQLVDALGLDQGTVLAAGTFCDSVANVAIPEDAVSLVVYVDGPMFGPADCGLDGTGIGVRGTITASFV